MTKIICTIINDPEYDQRMHRICHTLVREGYEVELVGRHRPYSVELTKRDFEQTRLHCWFEEGKLFYLEYNIRLFIYLLTHFFQIVCSVDLDTLFPGYMTSLLKWKHCVYDAHEYFTEVPELADRPISRKLWELLQWLLVPRIRYKYTVNESLAKILEDRYGGHFEVIRNIPPLDERMEVERSEENIGDFIIYQGVLNVGRGLPELIQAMETVDMPLYLVGGGDISSDLRTLADVYDLRDRVTFPGFVKPEELRAMLQQAAIGINLVEMKGLSYYYSLSNKFFDYIHAGLPQVTMNFPEYQKFNREFRVAVLIDELTPETIGRAINKLLHDRTLYQTLHQNCLKARHHYNWQAESKKLVEFYRQIGQ